MILHQLLLPICRLWFMEYAIIGVICGMVVIGTSLLIASQAVDMPSTLPIIFLFLNQNIRCGYSKEPSQ